MSQNNFMGGVSGILPDVALDQQAVMRRRALADALTASSMKGIDPMRSAGNLIVPIAPMEGLAQLGEALLARHVSKDAQSQEQELAQRAQARIRDTFEGTPTAFAPPPSPTISSDMPQFGGMDAADSPLGLPQLTPGLAQQPVVQRQGGLLNMDGIRGNDALVQALRMQSQVDPMGALKGIVDASKPTELQRDAGFMGKTGPDMFAAKYPAHSQYAQVDPSKYTPESLARFDQTKNYADLRPIQAAHDLPHRNTGTSIEYYLPGQPDKVVFSTPYTPPPNFVPFPGEPGAPATVLNGRTGQTEPVRGPTGGPVQSPLKPIPESISNGYMQNNVALGKIEAALASVSANPKAFGLTNLAPDMVVQRLDPQGLEARARVADIGSLKIHDRSGAAVTASETPRLKPFIPQVTDSPEKVQKLLGLFKQEYEAMQKEYLDAYGPDRGFKGFAQPQQDGSAQQGSAPQPQPGKPPQAQPSKPAAQVAAKVLTMADVIATSKARGVPVEAVLKAARDKGYQVPGGASGSF
jgi:hypothetical protein